jgi:sialic acid synthase SpsE
MLQEKISIVAELAQGYEGDYQLSKRLIQAAAQSNADIIKFQMVYADELGTPDYQYYNFFKQLEFGIEQWIELKNYADSLNMKLAMDVFGLKSLNVCIETGIEIIKLHPTDITNVSLLEAVRKSPIKEVIIGVGGAFMSEIEMSLEILGTDKNIALLLGFQGYPTPLDTNQLSRIQVISTAISPKFPNVVMGFADHELANSPHSLSLPVLAVGMGARVIEKHFTLSRNMKLEDSESALSADEFLEFSTNLKNLMVAVDIQNHADNFGMSELEMKYRKNIRRHVVLQHNLEAGSIVRAEDLVLKRSSCSNPFTEIHEAVGKRVKNSIMTNQALSYDNIIAE